MKKLIKPSAISGRVVAPASKSVAQRAIVAAMLAEGTSVLHNLTLCDDTSAALQLAQDMGAKVEQRGNEYHITAGGFLQTKGIKHLFSGESGLLTRMVAPVLSLLDTQVTLSGHGSLAMRPLNMVQEALESLGVQVVSDNGRLPLQLQGPLQGGACTIDGSVSSQLLTGLLMALPLAPRDSTLTVLNLKSKPYIDITIDLLQHFGVQVSHNNYKVFHIKGGQQYIAGQYSVEGDWSGASCLLTAGAVAGEVQVENLDPQSPQADKAMLEVLRLAGVRYEIVPGATLSTVLVYKSTLHAFEFDATECPDLFPAIVSLAAYADGVTVLHGAQRLTHKESNRAVALQQEFGKLGIRIEVDEDTMRVHGGVVHGGTVSAHNDHRIAMCMAVAALSARGDVQIEQAEAVAKSYPHFWADLEHLSQ